MSVSGDRLLQEVEVPKTAPSQPKAGSSSKVPRGDSASCVQHKDSLYLAVADCTGMGGFPVTRPNVILVP